MCIRDRNRTFTLLNCTLRHSNWITDPKLGQKTSTVDPRLLVARLEPFLVGLITAYDTTPNTLPLSSASTWQIARQQQPGMDNQLELIAINRVINFCALHDSVTFLVFSGQILQSRVQGFTPEFCNYRHPATPVQSDNLTNTIIWSIRRDNSGQCDIGYK